jgi:hypothetical protein
MTAWYAGFDEVVRNLNKAVQEIEGRSMKGLLRAVAFIRYDMEHTQPLIPTDTGNLRASWISEAIYVKGKPAVICGFGANYAVFVHENIGAHFQRPGAGAMFFSAALNRNHRRILVIIREEAKIP